MVYFGTFMMLTKFLQYLFQLAVMNVGSGYEDDDLLAQANALLEDDSMPSTEKKMLNRGQPMKKVAIKRDSTFNVVSEQRY